MCSHHRPLIEECVNTKINPIPRLFSASLLLLLKCGHFHFPTEERNPFPCTETRSFQELPPGALLRGWASVCSSPWCPGPPLLLINLVWPLSLLLPSWKDVFSVSASHTASESSERLVKNVTGLQPQSLIQEIPAGLRTHLSNKPPGDAGLLVQREPRLTKLTFSTPLGSPSFVRTDTDLQSVRV